MQITLYVSKEATALTSYVLTTQTHVNVIPSQLVYISSLLMKSVTVNTFYSFFPFFFPVFPSLLCKIPKCMPKDWEINLIEKCGSNKAFQFQISTALMDFSWICKVAWISICYFLLYLGSTQCHGCNPPVLLIMKHRLKVHHFL